MVGVSSVYWVVALTLGFKCVLAWSCIGTGRSGFGLAHQGMVLESERWT